MWKEFLKELTTEWQFSGPAAYFEVVAAEEELGVQFPDELRSLLQEANGVMGEYGLNLVWPIERIKADNLSFRSNEDYRHLYMPFDSLLFFGDAGTGDQFAFAIHGGVIRRPDVFAWNHEDDSRTWAAPSMKKYFEWWLTGQIKL